MREPRFGNDGLDKYDLDPAPEKHPRDRLPGLAALLRSITAAWVFEGRKRVNRVDT